MQYAEFGYGPIHRRGSRHRLHPRGFHRQQPALRPDSRLYWEPFVLSLQAHLEFQGTMRHGRRTQREMDDRASGWFAQNVGAFMVREPEDGPVSDETEQR